MSAAGTARRSALLGLYAIRLEPGVVVRLTAGERPRASGSRGDGHRFVDEGLLERVPNADHRRSPLVRLTEDGTVKYSAIDARQAVWVNRLAGGIGRAQLETTARVLDELCRRLEAGDD